MITLNPNLLHHLVGFKRLLADVERSPNQGPVRRYGRRLVPRVNVFKGDETVLVTAEVPGIAAEDIDLKAQADRLTISGTVANRNTNSEDVCHQCERPNGRFKRDLSLTFRIDPETVEATCEDGILTVKLNRGKDDKPKKITVT